VTFSGRARSVVLTAHIVVSVGWLGAVAAFAALAVVGLASQDAQRVRGVYLVMEPVGWFLLVPLAVASLLTGLAQSLGGAWGLFRHYWVVFKLLINVLAILLLLMYMQTLEHFADLASRDDVSALRDPSPLLHSVLALILLLVATTLGVFKPRGLTPYGRRRRT
jgi:uncharacterized membrane protein